MARPRIQHSEPFSTAVDDATLAQASADMTQLGQHIALVESTYGDNIPFDLYRLEARARDIKTVISGAAWELGRILIRIRAHVDHGEFLASLQRMGYAPRWAQKCMQAAQKFEGSPQRQMLAQQLSQTKLLELLSEDDGDLDELANGGTLAGLTLDAVDRMSVRELKAALRKERDERADEKAADEEIIRKKDDRINRLSRRSTRSGAREQVATLLEDLDRYSVEAFTFIKQARDTIGAIESIYVDSGETVDEEVQQRIDANVESVRAWYDQLISATGE